METVITFPIYFTTQKKKPNLSWECGVVVDLDINTVWPTRWPELSWCCEGIIWSSLSSCCATTDCLALSLPIDNSTLFHPLAGCSLLPIPFHEMFFGTPGICLATALPLFPVGSRTRLIVLEENLWSHSMSNCSSSPPSLLTEHTHGVSGVVNVHLTILSVYPVLMKT